MGRLVRTKAFSQAGAAVGTSLHTGDSTAVQPWYPVAGPAADLFSVSGPSPLRLPVPDTQLLAAVSLTGFLGQGRLSLLESYKAALESST